MFLRMLGESFVRQRRRKLLAGLAILLGTTAVTAMLALATTIGDRIHRELAVYGANITVYPKADTLDVKIGGQTLRPTTGGVYLHASDLEKLHGIFWANNITGLSPELDSSISLGKLDSVPPSPVPAAGFWFQHNFGDAKVKLITGATQLHPWWKLQGSAPQGSGQIVLGATLAKSLKVGIGDRLMVLGVSDVADPVTVTGILTTGDATEAKAIFELSTLQQYADLPDAVSRVDVSARTKPEDAFARKDPDTLSPKQRDLWYCRPYANSIAYQIREAIPGAAAEQVRQVEQSEGTILERISGLMWLVSAAAMLAAAVAVSAAMATAVLERRTEIGLMRSLGASKVRIASLFYSEAGLLALLGGIVGYGIGSLLAALLTARIFGEQSGITLRVAMAHAFNPALLPVVLGIALLVAIAGSTASIRSALRMDPSAVLRNNA
ncbi:ABC transporter permease [Granulicella mallensis]|jgi:putative ABC transport system permease protein|uniref:Putative ABC transport system permease protein n=1 Tax=Granulicella mallensis TaxID=940614 RepID=A0A7W7ZLJ9_9BACT|nr:ABC transporter permease [Granulicella mallensis]MBB5061962.1 putative ABC transport system permease protein [Granulicella mallensis]